VTSPKPDNAAAVSFLRRWAPQGPWVLTAIRPDRKSIDTQSFGPKTESQLTDWLEQFNGRYNIYFQVNPPLYDDAGKKTKREEIKELAWLHVDIDPRAGEDIQEERDRALRLLTERLPKGVPPPTAVVFSGGGYQGFWRLADPLPINGELERAEEAKRYNQQLEILFGADHCHNVDRIMRLPGTINLPDAKKAKKGRVPTLAELVSFEDHAYPLGDFTPAPTQQTPGETGFTGASKTVQVSGNVERIADVSELDQWSVPDRTKVIIVQGRHPDERKEKDDSRSAWVFDCLCSMVRCGVPDDVMFSVITDPDFGISESVLQHGANAQKYAIRQIERAHEYAIDPWLTQLNNRYAVIANIGGRCRVVEEVEDEVLGRSRLTRQSFDDFRNFYCNKFVKVGEDSKGNPIMKPVGAWWINHPMRRQFGKIVFAPNKDVQDAYNLWKGFSVAAKPGDCSLFLAHLRDNVCQGDERLYNYLMGWLARMVQDPGSPGHVAIVMRGGKGVGKSFVARQIGMLFGRHFLHISNPSHLIGNFNSHLRDAVFLFADEAFYAGDKKHASILKTLITEDTLQIEAKGVDVETAPNYVHLMMASNDEHVVPASGDERRFFVLDVGEAQQQKVAYFSAIAQQMDNGGREALLHHLLTYDLSDYRVQDVPQTQALRDQKDLSLSSEEDWWLNKLVEGTLLPDVDGWPTEVIKDHLTDDYIEHTKRWNVSRRGNQTALGKFMSKVCPRLSVIQKLTKVEVPSGDGYVIKVERRLYHWIIPDLEACRARWEELHGPREWAVPAQGNLGGGRAEEDVPF
jgi:hypothetical protein